MNMHSIQDEKTWFIKLCQKGSQGYVGEGLKKGLKNKRQKTFKKSSKNQK